MIINYDGRKFVGISNSENGEVGHETIFSYYQDGDLLTGVYGGGEILGGQLMGTIDNQGNLEFFYHHINQLGELKAGHCKSTPELLSDGRIRLYESWQWFDGARGTSIVEEVLKESP